MRAIWPGALLVVYLAATTLVLLIGHASVSSMGILMHVVLLIAVASATWLPNVPLWLRAWTPLLALPLLYAELPSIISAAGHTQLFDHRVIGWEQALFGEQPARTWVTRWSSPALSEALHAAYLSYYAIIFSIPAALWLTRRRSDFAAATFVLMLTFVACFAVYVVFPVAGPRYYWPSVGSDDAPMRRVTLWLLEAGSSRGTAFPSSHVAVAVTQSILGVRYFGPRGLILALLAIGLALGAVYGGFHYAIDVIAGVAYGALVAGLGAVAFARLRSRKLPYANATAPT